MKKVALLFVFAFTIIGLAVYAQETAPKISLENHNTIATLTVQNITVQQELQTIVKRYQDQLNADPQYVEVSKKATKLGEDYTAVMLEINKGVDTKKWRFDNSKLEFVPMEAPKPTEKK